MATAYTTAAASTAVATLEALRSVTGKTAEMRELNEAIDAAIAAAQKILAAQDDDPPTPGPVERR